MAFFGYEFVFDGLPCSEYGLMVYDFGSNTQGDSSFKPGEIQEDRIAGRYDSLMYGLTQNQPLEYTLVFGANMESVDAARNLDRFEVEAIAAWLIGHDTWKWLEISQSDMETFRYRCIITDLKMITYGNMPWAFSCNVTCDSPFAYTFPEVKTVDVSGETDFVLYNRSTYNGFYRPQIVIETSAGGDISIVNTSDNDREFKFTGLQTGTPLSISIDNQNQVITNNLSMNLYDSFNKKFFRMVRGQNVLKINATSATIKFVCEFPVNIGG